MVAYNWCMPDYLSRRVRVYLVDDHDIVRRGIRDVLVPARDISVVGDSGSVREAVPAILQLEPDVMLLDLHLQDGSGIDVSRAVRSVKPGISGLLLTAAGDDEARAAVLLAGASGYVVKLSRSGSVMDAVRKVQPGTTIMSEADIERASRQLLALMDSLSPPLTEQQRHTLGLVVAGRTDSEIADDQGSRESDADVAGLVARVAGALLGTSGSSGDAAVGRHRAGIDD